MSEFSLSFVIRQQWYVRVFTDLPYCIQYYVIHLCVQVIGELCSFITVYNAKMYESRISERPIFISFCSMKEGCMNIQLLCPSFGDVRDFTDLPYLTEKTWEQITWIVQTLYKILNLPTCTMQLGPSSSDFHNSNLFSEHLSTHCTLEL